MPKFDAEDEFPPDIAAAFDNYATPPLSRDFEAKFWTQFEARRGRYRGFAGFLRRLWEIEIEGVAVWRLALSTFSGGATCALFLACALGFSIPQNAPIAPLPAQIPPTAMNAFAFYRRDWEEDFLPKIQPKPAPPSAPRKGGDFSWNGSQHGSNAPLA